MHCPLDLKIGSDSFSVTRRFDLNLQRASHCQMNLQAYCQFEDQNFMMMDCLGSIKQKKVVTI